MPLENHACAQYAVLTLHDTGWSVEFRTLQYSLERLEELFESSGLNSLDNNVVKLFRFQYQTGIHVAYWYFNEMRDLAASQGVAVADIFDTFPLPKVVQEWLETH